MSELDKGALEAAAKALYTTWIDGPGAACMEPWSDDEDDEPDWQSVARNDAITSITAYLAVRPTPDAAAMERDVIEPSDECPLSERVDGKLHTWRFDGDDPYVFCHWCGEYRDALTNRVIRRGRKAVSR